MIRNSTCSVQSLGIRHLIPAKFDAKLMTLALQKANSRQYSRLAHVATSQLPSQAVFLESIWLDLHQSHLLHQPHRRCGPFGFLARAHGSTCSATWGLARLNQEYHGDPWWATTIHSWGLGVSSWHKIPIRWVSLSFYNILTLLLYLSGHAHPSTVCFGLEERY